MNREGLCKFVICLKYHTWFQEYGKDVFYAFEPENADISYLEVSDTQIF